MKKSLPLFFVLFFVVLIQSCKKDDPGPSKTHQSCFPFQYTTKYGKLKDKTTKFEYDGSGNLTKETLYDTTGKLIEGYLVSYTYEGGKLKSQKRVDGNYINDYTYEYSGNYISKITTLYNNGNSYIKTYSYDNEGNMTDYFLDDTQYNKVYKYHYVYADYKNGRPGKKYSYSQDTLRSEATYYYDGNMNLTSITTAKYNMDGSYGDPVIYFEATYDNSPFITVKPNRVNELDNPNPENNDHDGNYSILYRYYTLTSCYPVDNTPTVQLTTPRVEFETISSFTKDEVGCINSLTIYGKYYFSCDTKLDTTVYTYGF